MIILALVGFPKASTSTENLQENNVPSFPGLPTIELEGFHCTPNTNYRGNSAVYILGGGGGLGMRLIVNYYTNLLPHNYHGNLRLPSCMTLYMRLHSKYLLENSPSKVNDISAADPRSISIASKLPTEVAVGLFSGRVKLKEELLKRIGGLSFSSCSEEGQTYGST